MPRGPRLHLVIRFGAGLFGVQDAPREHGRLLEEYGAVWFGKVGKPLSAANIARLNAQATEQETYVYLVEKRAGKYVAHRGRIVVVTRVPPRGSERRMVPSYYRDSGVERHMSLWMKLDALTPVDTVELRELEIRTSGCALLDTLRKSMAGMFLVRARRAHE